jgi:predicted RNA-binding Zn-ribbon protein involved in translation (DUF1610 family)
MAKLLPVRTVVCTGCRARIQASPRYTFLGLFRFTCPRCGQGFLYPMSARRRKWYIGVAVVFTVLSLALLAFAGQVALPGILPIAAVIALVQDSSARKRVAAAETGAWSPAFTPGRPDS